MKLNAIIITLFATLCSCTQKSEWKQEFSFNGDSEWSESWFLEGERASITCDSDGMLFSAGPTVGDHADHAVLWTKQEFSGDVRVEYDYSRVDSLEDSPTVNILYLQATGLGTENNPEDIYLSRDKRTVPFMKSYFLNMDLVHISYAASGEPRSNYVSARRYPTKIQKEFQKSTQVYPIYEDIFLFKPGEEYHIVAEKIGNRLTFTAEREGKIDRFEWSLDKFSPVDYGRVGIRHMYGRVSRYQNIKIFTRR